MRSPSMANAVSREVLVVEDQALVRMMAADALAQAGTLKAHAAALTNEGGVTGHACFVTVLPRRMFIAMEIRCSSPFDASTLCESHAGNSSICPGVGRRR